MQPQCPDRISAGIVEVGLQAIAGQDGYEPFGSLLIHNVSLVLADVC
jgi:hypothetical protein